MDRKTRKLNNCLSRVRFWNALKLHLDSFVGITQPIEALTSNDRINLNEVHYMLHLCRNMAEYKEDYHKQKLKEVFNHE